MCYLHIQIEFQWVIVQILRKMNMHYIKHGMQYFNEVYLFIWFHTVVTVIYIQTILFFYKKSLQFYFTDCLSSFFLNKVDLFLFLVYLRKRQQQFPYFNTLIKKLNKCAHNVNKIFHFLQSTRMLFFGWILIFLESFSLGSTLGQLYNVGGFFFFYF